MPCTPGRDWHTPTPRPTATSTPSRRWHPAQSLVAEMRGAFVAGLPAAQVLLARAIAPSSTEVAVVGLPDGPATVRRALLAACEAAWRDRRTDLRTDGPAGPRARPSAAFHAVERAQRRTPAEGVLAREPGDRRHRAVASTGHRQEHRAPPAEHPRRGAAPGAGSRHRRLPPGTGDVRARRLGLDAHRPPQRLHPRHRPAAAATRETVQIAVLDGREVVYVERRDSPQTLRLFGRVGHRNDAHCTSNGKLLLAFLSPGRLDVVLDGWVLAPRTQFTITDQSRAARGARRHPGARMGGEHQRGRDRRRVGRRADPQRPQRGRGVGLRGRARSSASPTTRSSASPGPRSKPASPSAAGSGTATRQRDRRRSSRPDSTISARSA